MASPQRENGFVAVASELAEALARIRISGEANQVLWVIFRKTYGYQKKEDRIALSQFVLATGLTKVAVSKALRKLVEMGIITKKGNAHATIYSIQKDYSQWKSLPKKVTVTKKGKNFLPKKSTTIDNYTKDTNTYEKKTMKPNKLGNYNPDAHNDYEEAIDLDSNELVVEETPKKSKKLSFPVGEVVDYWNSLPNWKATGVRGTPPNPSAIETLLPKTKYTADVKLAVMKKSTAYTAEEMKGAIKKYANEIVNRKKDDGYFEHRFSLFDFVSRPKGLQTYANR